MWHKNVCAKKMWTTLKCVTCQAQFKKSYVEFHLIVSTKVYINTWKRWAQRDMRHPFNMRYFFKVSMCALVACVRISSAKVHILERVQFVCALRSKLSCRPFFNLKIILNDFILIEEGWVSVTACENINWIEILIEKFADLWRRLGFWKDFNVATFHLRQPLHLTISISQVALANLWHMLCTLNSFLSTIFGSLKVENVTRSRLYMYPDHNFHDYTN